MSIPLPPPFSDPVITCPSCEHGIDTHGPVESCGVGDVAGALCGCPWSPNHIAAEAVRRARADEREHIAAGIWPCVEPIVTWVAGINSERTERGEQ